MLIETTKLWLKFSVESQQDEHKYFARRLHGALDGIGTDDVTLMRIIVGRAEIDLGCIKDAYAEMYSETLVSAVKARYSFLYLPPKLFKFYFRMILPGSMAALY